MVISEMERGKRRNFKRLYNVDVQRAKRKIVMRMRGTQWAMCSRLCISNAVNVTVIHSCAHKIHPNGLTRKQISQIEKSIIKPNHQIK